MSQSKLLAFIVMLVIFIPLMAVPEIEKNPFNDPTSYEEVTTPIKDYDIVSELKALEGEGIPTAVYQRELSEIDTELDDDDDSDAGVDDRIRDVSGVSTGSGILDSGDLDFEADLEDAQLKEFLEGKLQRFKDANLNPSYFIIPDIKYRYRIMTILNEVTAELGLPEIELVVKKGEDELSTEILEHFEQLASFNTGDLQTPEYLEKKDKLFEQYLIDYIDQNRETLSDILTIDVSTWGTSTSWCLNSFISIIERHSIDIVIRIENISKDTSPEVFGEIIDICQSIPEVPDDESTEETEVPGTRGTTEFSTPEDKSGIIGSGDEIEDGRGSRHIQEIILGATPESDDMKSVDGDEFTLVVDVINGFYYVILLTCLLPNLYFVAWAGFIRHKRNQDKNPKAIHRGSSFLRSMNEKKMNLFNRKLKSLESQLGPVILFNKDEESTQKFKTPKEVTGPDIKAYKKRMGAKWPDVTIIVPCFNEQKGIALAVEKCYNQNYKGRIEILVIDDGSKDYTLKIAKIFEGPFPDRNVRVYHKPNGGKADALNFGIKRATGQIILTTDGDSHMDPDAVEQLVKGFQANPHAGIVGGFVVIRNEKDSHLVKLQQIEYIFTQDVFRLPQSESASVLIIPGPVFSMGGRVAKTHTASTRTCVEDADLTDTILKDNWGTVAVTDATAHTQAPTTWKAWYKQRKRWVYGQFQVWRENKSFLKRNFWGLYSFFTWFSALLITGMLIASTIALAFIGEWNFFSLLITAQTTVIFTAYFLTRAISLRRYKYGKHLIFYLPMQVVYDLVNGVLCAWLFLSYLTGYGVNIKFGPELVRIR